MIFNSSPPYILAAPLCGYTTSPYREILHQFPYDLIFTEMVSVDALFYGNEKTENLYHVSENQNRIGLQLFGTHVDRFLYSVEKLSTQSSFRVFDINCGCPVHKVVKTGGGAALLKEPDKIYQILYTLKKTFPHLHFSAKIRTGLTQKEQPYREVAQAVQEGGASFLTVHGRTQSQIYSGDVDYRAIREIKNQLHIPVIGNGGIFDPQDAQNFLQKTGVDGIMIARGLIGTPWIAQYIKEYLTHGTYEPLSWRDKVSLMHEHFHLEDQFSPNHGFKEFKKSGLAYLKGLSHGKNFRIRLATASSSQETRNILEELCQSPEIFTLTEKSL